MNTLSTVTGILTYPARTAFTFAVGGLRTTSRVVSWAIAQAKSSQSPSSRSQWSSDPAPVTVARVPDVDPMQPTRTPPTKAPAKKAQAKKVPASQVPLKSAPTPSLPAATRSVDVDDFVEPVPAKETPAKKTAAKKTPAGKVAAKKAPSKKAAVLAPALGLSEDEVLTTSDVDKG